MSYNDVKHSEIQNAEHGCTIPGEHTRAMCGTPIEQTSIAEELDKEPESPRHHLVGADLLDGATTD